MTLEEEIDEVLHFVKVRVRETCGDIYVYPTLRRDHWISLGWRITTDSTVRPAIDVSADTLAEVLQKAREAAMSLKDEEKRLAEILGVDHAQAA